MVRPSVEFEVRVIMSNTIYNLTKQKGIGFV